MSSKTRPSMIIVVGPSGVGKSSFVERVTQEIPRLFDTVTYTTREMRSGESEGQPYHFVTEERFKALIEEGFFIEHALVHGRLYGTPKHQIDDAIAKGRVVIMDVDVQGARTFKAKYPDSFAIFIHPPDLEELKKRVVLRDGLQLKDLEIRMKNAKVEIEASQEFDFQMINDDFNTSYAKFKKVIEELLEIR